MSKVTLTMPYDYMTKNYTFYSKDVVLAALQKTNKFESLTVNEELKVIYGVIEVVGVSEGVVVDFLNENEDEEDPFDFFNI